MIEIGRLCVKLAGRDAGKKAVIVDVLDEKYVLIDGQTRRRKCNVLHIEPLNQTVKIAKNASHEEVAKVLSELGLDAMSTKPKQPSQKPMKKRKTSEQLRAQREEKKKLRDILKPKKKEESIETKTEKTGKEKETEKPASTKESKTKSEKKASKKDPDSSKSEKKPTKNTK